MNKLRYDKDCGFWYQPFWEPVFFAVYIGGIAFFLFALISGIIDKVS